MKIAFLYPPVAFGQHRKPLDFSDPEGHSAGLTGTDLIALAYPRELADLGHEVTLFCHGAEPTGFVGAAVKVEPYSAWERRTSLDHFDAAVAISNPNCLELADPRTFRVVNRQVAGFGIDTDPGFARYVDLVLCPSETARLHVSAGHDDVRFGILPNGCYPDQYPRVEKTPGSVVYCSSPDRGLHWLLAMWPEIRRRVPHATLLIAYQSIQQWLDHHTNPAKPVGSAIDRECTRRAHYIRNALRVLSGHGVTVASGGMSHREIGEHLARAEAMLYPLDPLAFTETFGCAVLEACAAGCAVVTTDADAFGEVHGAGVAIVKHPVGDRLEAFVEVAVRVLTDPGYWAEFSVLGADHAREHDWRTLAKRFEGMLVEGVEQKRVLRDPSKTSIYGKIAVGETVTYRDPAHPERGALEFHPITAAPEEKKVTIDLVLTRYASGEEPIDVEHPYDSNSGGGCRAGFMGLVKALPKLGYDVRAWSNFKVPGVFGSIEDGYVDYRQWPGGWQPGNPLPFEPRDVLLCYYATFPLQGIPGGKTLRVASHHTYQLPFPGTYEWVDLNVAPSQHAVDALRAIYGGEWAVMPNAVQPDLPEWRPVPGRCVWHTSASRGLWNLLEVWPEIRQRVPGASLHIIGDVLGWMKHYEGRHDRQAKFADRVRDAIDHLAPAAQYLNRDVGVSFFGKLPRAELLRELSEASCFPFSFEAAAPCETFSVCTMEALSVGVPVVLYPGDAMSSIYGSGGPVWCARPDSLVDYVARTLEGGQGNGLQTRQAFGRSHTFANKARALDGAVRKALAARQE